VRNTIQGLLPTGSVAQINALQNDCWRNRQTKPPECGGEDDMSTPSKKMIEGEIRKLRAVAESNDPVLSRIAYAVETALRWSIEDTKGWERPSEDVYSEAEILKKETTKV
jgi:hypothetical protein